VKAVWARAADGALECVLSAPADRAMSAPLAYPAGWTTKEGDDLILPFGEGVAYPVCDPEVVFTGCRFRLSHGMEASMGFFGVARGGVWAMTGVEDTLCGEIVCRTNAPYSAGVAWRASDGGRWGRDRRVRFFFARSIGEAAGKYRAWREAQGRVRTLAEKTKKNPHIASFPGTADFWLWDDNDQNRLYNWPLVEETPPLDVKRIAAEIKKHERVLLFAESQAIPDDKLPKGVVGRVFREMGEEWKLLVNTSSTEAVESLGLAPLGMRFTKVEQEN
jgi:hypothetical protein